MKQRPRSTENNDVWLPSPWVRGSWASMLTSHVMTNSERLPPPPLTLAGVTFGAGERRQISLALLTSHDAEKARVIILHVTTSKRQREVTFWHIRNFSNLQSLVRYQQTCRVRSHGLPVVLFITKDTKRTSHTKDVTLVNTALSG